MSRIPRGCSRPTSRGPQSELVRRQPVSPLVLRHPLLIVRALSEAVSDAESVMALGILAILGGVGASRLAAIIRRCTAAARLRPVPCGVERVCPPIVGTRVGPLFP